MTSRTRASAGGGGGGCGDQIGTDSTGGGSPGFDTSRQPVVPGGHGAGLNLADHRRARNRVLEFLVPRGRDGGYHHSVDGMWDRGKSDGAVWLGAV